MLILIKTPDPSISPKRGKNNFHKSFDKLSNHSIGTKNCHITSDMEDFFLPISKVLLIGLSVGRASSPLMYIRGVLISKCGNTSR